MLLLLALPLLPLLAIIPSRRYYYYYYYYYPHYLYMSGYPLLCPQIPTDYRPEIKIKQTPHLN